MKENEIEINGEVYVKKDSLHIPAQQNLEGLSYVIVRTYSAGVFAGYLTERVGKEGKILHARRLWYWSGAASLSQLALDGVENPDGCKFPEEVPEITLTEIIEVLLVSEKAKDSIGRVKVWKV